MASRNASGNGAGGSRKNQDEWITLREAAEEAGISVSTLRNWYRKGEIDSRLDRGPHGKQRLVRKTEILERTSSGPAREHGDGASVGHNGQAVTDGEDPSRQFSELIEELEKTRERAARAESRAEFLTERLARLETRFEALLLSEPARLDDRTEAPQDGSDEDFPPEDEDEYLPLVQRWRVQRKRRKVLRDSGRRQAPRS